MTIKDKGPVTEPPARAPKQTVNSTDTIPSPQDVSRGNLLLEAALGYAARDWPVLPLHSVDKTGACSCRKPECPSPGKHPHTPQGLKDATTEVKTIRDWWAKWPNANIGILTGEVSGLVVLDVDPRNGGEKALEALLAQHGKLPETVEQQTGGGGRHLLFEHPGGQIKRRNIAPGLDVKADGGYIVVAPSGHASGDYVWKSPLGPDSTRLAEIPRWLLKRVREKSCPQLGDNGGRGIAKVRDGKRNTYLAKVAGTLRRQGLDGTEMEPALQAINKGKCDPPLPESEVRKIALGMNRYLPGPHSQRQAEASEFPRPLPLGEAVKSAEEIDWLWPGYIARGHITLLAGHPKAGKSTLMRHMLRAIGADEEFLTAKFEQCRVLVITEESLGVWRQSYEPLWADQEVKHIYLSRRPLSQKPTVADWLLFMTKALPNWADEYGYDLVVIDTLRDLAPLQLNENKSEDVQTLTRALRTLADSGVAVLVIHHLRKSGGNEGMAISGSTALAAATDINIELTGVDGEARCRKLALQSRLDESPSDLRIELTDDGFVCHGSEMEIRLDGLLRQIEERLPVEPPGITAKDLHAEWEGNEKPGINKLRKVLSLGADKGKWRREGEGKARGDAYHFCRREPEKLQT